MMNPRRVAILVCDNMTPVDELTRELRTWIEDNLGLPPWASCFDPYPKHQCLRNQRVNRNGTMIHLAAAGMCIGVITSPSSLAVSPRHPDWQIGSGVAPSGRSSVERPQM